MASVEELILASKQNKSPFIHLLEGVAQGYGNAQNTALERTKTLMAIDQQRQEMERKAQMQEMFRQHMAGQQEAKTGQDFKSVAGKPQPVMPIQKLEWEVDDKGNPSYKIKTETAKEISYQAKDYAGADGKTRIGKFDPSSGRLIQSPDDAFAPKTVSQMPAAQNRNTAELRKEFTSLSKDYFSVNDALARVRASSNDPSPAGDLSLIYNYMKTLDPGSTVREGEFATAAQSGSFGQQIQAAAKKIASGQRLTDEQRADFVARAEKLYEGSREIHQKRVDEYKRLAIGSGVDPELVIVNQSVNTAEPSGQNKKTTVKEISDLQTELKNRNVKQVNTQEEYDALPSGAEYVDSEGNKARKR